MLFWLVECFLIERLSSLFHFVWKMLDIGTDVAFQTNSQACTPILAKFGSDRGGGEGEGMVQGEQE